MRAAAEERVNNPRVTERVYGNVRIKILSSQAFDLQVQRQLYLRNRMDYPHQIWNEHGKGINNAESSEISKNTLTDLYRFVAWTVTNM